MTAHLTRRQLEELAGSASPADRSALAHLAGCEVCAARKGTLEAARARFLERHPAPAFARATALRARQPAAPELRFPRAARALALGVGLAAAAAAALWMLAPVASDPQAIRWKGGASLEVHVKRGDSTFVLRDGAALSAGDQLGFVYALPQPAYLLLLGIDDTGAVTRYFPAEGAARARLSAAARAQLPIGVELDQHRGSERLVALFSTTEIDEGAARRALALAFERTRRRGQDLSAMTGVELDADQASVWYRKP